MRTRLISLVLLLVLGLGLSAGPHPCQAQAATREAPKAAAGSGCHSHEAAASPTAGPSLSARSGEEDCCAGKHSALCQATCQSVAIVHSGLLAFAALPSVPAEVPVFEAALPPFAHGIDHIPLA